MMTDEEYINQFLNLPRSELINIKYITDGFHIDIFREFFSRSPIK